MTFMMQGIKESPFGSLDMVTTIIREMRQMPDREKLRLMALCYAILPALFTIWFCVPYCKKRIRERHYAAVYKIFVVAASVFFLEECLLVIIVIWRSVK